jgi:hypothetical protein
MKVEVEMFEASDMEGSRAEGIEVFEGDVEG